MPQKKDATRVKGKISEISTGGNYDGVYSENSSNVNLNPDRIEKDVVQNPYYEGVLDLNPLANINLSLPEGVNDRENIKVVDNIYYDCNISLKPDFQ